ncbi:hypothetical protein D9741_15615 [Escherichia sp. E14V7]|nr:hypothetical protein D9740_11200 [Escherichia sp. E14V5]RZN02515.1 hypothetical protein D9741_15615 [Escherichia sp. E14V7]RZN29321.1 hypothetical protein D9739_03960 [Escherichia sp. E14V10]TGB59465.1 hypothetical protein CRT22_05010 [Escherichia sp. E5028]TGB75971.1 hypothetical protein CRI67_10395 [Escherichia sp. E4702]
MSTLLSLIGVLRHTNNMFIRIAKQTGTDLLPIFHPMMFPTGNTNLGGRLYYKSGKKQRQKTPASQRGFEIWWS